MTYQLEAFNLFSRILGRQRSLSPQYGNVTTSALVNRLFHSPPGFSGYKLEIAAELPHCRPESCLLMAMNYKGICRCLLGVICREWKIEHCSLFSQLLSFSVCLSFRLFFLPLSLRLSSFSLSLFIYVKKNNDFLSPSDWHSMTGIKGL